MLIPALAVALWIGVFAAGLSRPLVRRIGLRNAVRRPREAALVMLGCVLGTALIVGNLSVGDSFTASIRDQALGDMGALDAIVTYDNRDEWAAANARLASAPIRDVVTTTAVATMSAPVTSHGYREVSPRAKLIEADYGRAGSLGVAAGVPRGSGPGRGEVWVSHQAERVLKLHVGSVVTVHAKARQSLRVTRVVKNVLTSFLDGNVRAGDSFLVPPGTIAALQQADQAHIQPDWRTLVVSTQPHTVTAPAVAATDALHDRLTQLVTPFNGDVEMSRSNALRSAMAQGKTTGVFLTQIGAFGIIAGILLLINVLLMLAEERLAELGTMRAVGMSRSPLISSFSLEGGVYATVGAFLGGGIGVALGRVLVGFMNKLTNDSTDGGRDLPLHFAVERSTLITGVSLGFLVAAIAVIGTSYRVSRLEVIRALRDLPASRRTHRQAALPLMVLGLLVGPAVAYLGYTGPAPMLLLGGPIIFFASVGRLVNRPYGFEAGMITACLPLLVFSIFFSLLNKQETTGPANSVIAGVVTVGAGVLLINTLQGRIAHALRRVGRGRHALPTRLGLANPIAHRVRMLLTVTPFALVVFTLTYAEGLTDLINSNLHATSPTYAGDYKIFATSSSANPFDYSTLDDASLGHVAPMGNTIAQFSYAPDRAAKYWPVSAFTKELFADGVAPPPLMHRAKEFASDTSVYKAVLNDPDLIIVPDGFLFSSMFGTSNEDPDHGPRIGDTYTLVNPVTSEAHDVKVAAIRYQDVLLQGPLYGFPGLKKMFGERLVMTDAFVVDRGAEHDPLIHRLQIAGIENGLEARDIEQTSNAWYNSINGLINLFRSDLGIGIIVGVAGIGVVLVRSVRDRRRTIGTLRAMGFDAGEIGTSFLIEGGFVAVQGLVVGVGFGYLTVMALPGSNLIRALLGFRPGIPTPPPSVLIIATGLFIAALLASVIPARSASKIPPAVALRLVD
jgi:putative ABC transport system permease protein